MLKQSAVALGLGTIFGVSLEKSEVTKKKIIQDQMLFRDQRMLKVFLSASGTSAVVLSILQYSNSGYFIPRLSDTMVISNVVGGVSLGLGMTLGGGCPGTFLSAFGAGSPSAPYGLLGGLTGALIYSFLFKYISKYINSILNFGKITVNGDSEFWKCGLGFAVAMFGVITFVKYFFDPKTKKENEKNEGMLFMKNKSWSPVISGIMIGLLQLPMLYFTKSMLGSSTQYVVITGYLISKLFPSLKNQYMEKAINKKTSLFGVIMHFGMILGGHLSSIFSGNFKENRKIEITGSDKLKVFFSGFLLLFGARMTGGCNSGHGLSGMASLSLSSFIATAAIFAGGIGAAVVKTYLWSKDKDE